MNGLLFLQVGVGDATVVGAAALKTMLAGMLVIMQQESVCGALEQVCGVLSNRSHFTELGVARLRREERRF